MHPRVDGVTARPASLVLVLGVPLALGGWIPELEAAIIGMTKTPDGLRQHGLLERLASDEAMAGVDVRDAGDVPIEPAYRVDTDRRAKNRGEIIARAPADPCARRRPYCCSAGRPTAGPGW